MGQQNQDEERAAAQYRALRDRICAFEPAAGYVEPGDLPALTDQDHGATLRANPDILNDVTLDPDALADILAAPDSSLDGLYRRLGLYLAEQLKPAIKNWLLQDVIAECCERREQDEYEAHRPVPSLSNMEVLADDRGVLLELRS